MITKPRAVLFAIGAESEAPGEMRDPPIWLKSPTLGPVLTLCDQVLAPAFLAADREAIESQASHRRLTALAALAGLLAVSMALAQFALRPRGAVGGPWAVLEFVVMGLAFAAVLLGIVATRQADWIRQRHRAELIQALKFRLLVEPGRWAGLSGRMDSIEAWLREELDSIERLTRRDVFAWARRERAPEAPPPSPPRELPRAVLRDLIRYYLDRRLGASQDHSARRRRSRLARWVPERAGPNLFFLAGVALICHVVLDQFAAGRGSMLSRALLVAAAVLPAAGATLHTLRLVAAGARPRPRTRTKDVALRGLKSALKRDQSQQGILANLWSCEQVLEWDHRDWLRGVTKAEWLG